MKKTILCICLIIYFIACLATITSCNFSSETDEAAGTYYFVYEKGPIFYRENLDYKMILDGKGKGEYHKEVRVHTIKYKFEDPNIVITDNMTGIVYKGTLSDGKLLVYDGAKSDKMTSEFLFQSKY